MYTLFQTIMDKAHSVQSVLLQYYPEAWCRLLIIHMQSHNLIHMLTPHNDHMKSILHTHAEADNTCIPLCQVKTTMFVCMCTDLAVLGHTHTSTVLRTTPQQTPQINILAMFKMYIPMRNMQSTLLQCYTPVLITVTPACTVHKLCLG